jgi:DNA-binding beta-propeller fold protein YncE
MGRGDRGPRHTRPAVLDLASHSQIARPNPLDSDEAEWQGCGQKPSHAATGNDGHGASTESVAVNPATNTIYATSDTTGSPNFFGHTVYVIDGPTGDAANTTGCSNPPATLSVGSDPIFGDANPFGIAVDQATDTIYTANISNGEGPGTISIINGNVCNANDIKRMRTSPRDRAGRASAPQESRSIP